MKSNKNQLIAPSLGCWRVEMWLYNCICCFFFVTDKQGLVFEAVVLKARKDVFNGVPDVNWKGDACNTHLPCFLLGWSGHDAWGVVGSQPQLWQSLRNVTREVGWRLDTVSLRNSAASKTSCIYATSHLKGILFFWCLAGDHIWTCEGTFLLGPSLWLQSRASPCCPQCSDVS